MAQGFKTKKVSSSTTKAQKAQPVKKGGKCPSFHQTRLDWWVFFFCLFLSLTYLYLKTGRSVAPVKPSAVAQKLRKEVTITSSLPNLILLPQLWSHFSSSFFFPPCVVKLKKISRDVNTQIERTVVSRSVGKLSIMKPLRDLEESKKLQEKAAATKASSSKPKPRATTKSWEENIVDVLFFGSWLSSLVATRFRYTDSLGRTC